MNLLGYGLLILFFAVVVVLVIAVVGRTSVARAISAALDVEPTPDDDDDSKRVTDPANTSWDALAAHGALIPRDLPCYGPPPAIPGAPHPRHAQTGVKAWLSDVWAQTVEVLRERTRPVPAGDKPEVSEGWEQGHLAELDAMHDPEPIEPQDEERTEDESDPVEPDCEADPVVDERTEDDVEQDQDQGEEQAPEAPAVVEPKRELLAAALFEHTQTLRTVTPYNDAWMHSGMTGHLPPMTDELLAAMDDTDARGRRAVWA